MSSGGVLTSGTQLKIWRRNQTTRCWPSELQKAGGGSYGVLRDFGGGKRRGCHWSRHEGDGAPCGFRESTKERGIRLSWKKRGDRET